MPELANGSSREGVDARGRDQRSDVLDPLDRRSIAVLVDVDLDAQTRGRIGGQTREGELEAVGQRILVGDRKVHTVDIAPTLSTIVGAKPPSGNRGMLLKEVLQ